MSQATANGGSTPKNVIRLLIADEYLLRVPSVYKMEKNYRRK